MTYLQRSHNPTHKILRPPFFLYRSGPFGLALSFFLRWSRAELTLAILLHLLHLLTYLNMSGSCLLFLFTLLSKLVILDVTINRVGELVEFVQLFYWIFHEMEKSTQVRKLRNDHIREGDIPLAISFHLQVWNYISYSWNCLILKSSHKCTVHFYSTTIHFRVPPPLNLG